MKNKTVVLSALSIALLFGAYAVLVSAAPRPPPSADVAIYTGPGTWELSITAFENFLDWKGLTYTEVSKNDINRHDLRGLYQGIFFPGGWAWDYQQHLNNNGEQNLRDFIADGGFYIGMSAGAYLMCDTVVWEGDTYDYPLDVFQGDCIGPIEEIAPWPEYTMTTMSMNLEHEANVYEPVTEDILYYGEPYFVPDAGQEMQTLASWNVPSNPVADGAPGIIGFHYGAGRVLLVGPHPEIEEDDDRDGTDFANELDDFGSDWPFLWTAIDWLLQQPISEPPESPQGGGEPQCSDGLDNDSDGLIDLDDPGCDDENDDDETDPVVTQCSDGLDNDSDGFIDLDDPGCIDESDDDETDPTGPQSIFSDGFESGTLEGWDLQTVENHWQASQQDVYEGEWHAQARPRNTNEPASVMQRALDTSGYTGIELNYHRRLKGLDVADEFKAKWFDGTSWHVLEETGSDGANDDSYISKSFALSAAADNNPDVMIRFECTAGAVTEYCRVDNVEIIGQ